MTIKLGNDYMLWVETATPGTYVIIDGQGTLKRSRSRGTFSVASKQSAFDGQRTGLPKMQVTVDTLVDLPSTGFDRYENNCRADPQVPFNIQVRKNGSAGNGTTDVVFACSVVCSSIDDDAPMGDAIKFGTTLQAAAAPTTDKLA